MYIRYPSSGIHRKMWTHIFCTVQRLIRYSYGSLLCAAFCLKTNVFTVQIFFHSLALCLTVHNSRCVPLGYVSYAQPCATLCVTAGVRHLAIFHWFFRIIPGKPWSFSFAVVDVSVGSSLADFFLFYYHSSKSIQFLYSQPNHYISLGLVVIISMGRQGT